MTQIGYCCFTNTENIGDFALFKANQLMFPSFEIVEATTKKHEIRANIFGGGTMYPYSLRYNRYPKRQYEFAIGQGVESPYPRRRFSLPTNIVMLYRRMRFFGVRGVHSQATLKQHGLSSVVTGDSALYHHSNPLIKPNDNVVGINLVGERMNRRGSQNESFSAVVEFCEQVIADGKQLAFFPLCQKDAPALQNLYSRFHAHSEYIDFWGDEINQDLSRFFDCIQRCSFLVAERLHASVFAAFLGVPFLSIGYKPKCYDFVDTLNIERQLIFATEELLDGNLYQHYQAILNDDELVPQVSHRVEELRSYLSDASSQINAILESKVQR